MPTKQGVVAYEEGDPEALAALQQGYPRFLMPQLCRDLNADVATELGVGANEIVTVLPSYAVASDCLGFVGKGTIRASVAGLNALCVPEASHSMVKAFMQHTGQIVSSRFAADVLKHDRPRVDDGYADVLSALKVRIAEGANEDCIQDNPDILEADVSLYPTGMAAIYRAHQMLIDLKPGRTIQFGFPYVDTLKIQEKFNKAHSGQYVPFNGLDSDYDALRVELAKGDVTALFCEMPGNPLFHTIDLPRLRGILDEYDVALVIDDTLSTSVNVDVKPYADIIVSSLTKFFSGKADVMGGSLVINPRSRHHSSYRDWITAHHEDLLYQADAFVLEENSRGFGERMLTINDRARSLAGMLAGASVVEKVHYPSLVDTGNYDAIRKPKGGYGGVLSVVTKRPEDGYKLHDVLDVLKGPSLGTEFTLACLYTLLAHYHELDFAGQNNIAPHLLRVSVGEEADTIGRFSRALDLL